jgi:T-complex protein 1 subunit eta
MERVNLATGASTQSTCTDIQEHHLGTCGSFEERQIGGERFNIFSECPGAKTCTLILRGGAEQFIAEAERSLHDATMIVKRALKNTTIVAGGGACEMDLSSYLHGYADRNVPHKQQAVVKAFAKALEVIPRQLCDNAGFDATDILNRLRVEHRKGTLWAGVDFDHEGVRDNMEAFVWEPSLVKVNAIQAAVEAACLILSVDETISACLHFCTRSFPAFPSTIVDSLRRLTRRFWTVNESELTSLKQRIKSPSNHKLRSVVCHPERPSECSAEEGGGCLGGKMEY